MANDFFRTKRRRAFVFRDKRSYRRIIVFETISAFATVGTTLGITSKLSLIGKIVIIIVMFIGRLGPITMAVALMTRKRDQDKVNIQYPDEKIMVG